MRLHFPDDESKFGWLPMLLDAYAIIDRGVAAAITREEKRQNTKVACKKGCSSCCHTHKDIPMYPLELVGVYWFVIEKTVQPLRAVLKKQLLSFEKGGPCPFLTDDSCSIHPLRPVACRQFNVFRKPCEKDEDPFFTRRDDVLTPIQEYVDQAFTIMLPFYGITNEADKVRAIQQNLIHTQVSNLKSYKWRKLSERMDEFDCRRF